MKDSNQDGTGRMRYEQSHPWSFSGEGRTPEEQNAYRAGYDAIDWSDGKPNQARPRKTYPKPKAHGLSGF
jgi:hypothetical protein